jgi:hypothetical protein
MLAITEMLEKDIAAAANASCRRRRQTQREA